MRNAGVDERDELVLGFELGVKNVARHIYDLKKLHMLVAFVIFLHFKLNVLALGMAYILTAMLVVRIALISRLRAYFLHLKDCAR